MTDENKLDGQSRRTFLKTTGAVGAAATTGIVAFGGNAAAQSLDASSLNVNQRANRVAGLITVNNVNVQALNNVQVLINDVEVTVRNIRILNDNTVNITVSDVLSDITIEDNTVQLVVNLLSSGDTVLESLSTTVPVNN